MHGSEPKMLDDDDLDRKVQHILTKEEYFYHAKEENSAYDLN